jgi:hypothetical protein
MRLNLFAILLLVLPSAVSAYPQYIVKGYTNCASCHYSPTGGGLPNSYGYATQSATFPDAVDSKFLEQMRTKLQKNDVTGYKDDGATPKLQGDIGLDARLLVLSAYSGEDDEGGEGGEDGGGGSKTPMLIPMLVEVSGVLAYGPWITYGSVTPKKSGESSRSDTIFSREHWIGRKMGATSMIRAGRIVLPFGIRSPDHTLYTRRDFGFDKWGQSYGLEWDYYSERWMISTSGFVGDLIQDPSHLQQRGGVASVAYNIPGKTSFGLSFMGSASKATRVFAGSFFNRSKFLKHFYVMEEVSYRDEKSLDDLGTENELAAAFRMGWFPLESLDIYVEAASRRIFDHGELKKTRYIVGSQWHVLPWIELIPAVMFEEYNSKTEITPMGQLHVVF